MSEQQYSQHGRHAPDIVSEFFSNVIGFCLNKILPFFSSARARFSDFSTCIDALDGKICILNASNIPSPAVVSIFSGEFVHPLDVTKKIDFSAPVASDSCPQA